MDREGGRKGIRCGKVSRRGGDEAALWYSGNQQPRPQHKAKHYLKKSMPILVELTEDQLALLHALRLVSWSVESRRLDKIRYDLSLCCGALFCF